VWILNKDGKNFVVFDPRCTHLNCPYYWDKQANRFHCPCHDGRFDIDGNVIGGPPPRAHQRAFAGPEAEAARRRVRPSAGLAGGRKAIAPCADPPGRVG